MACSRCYNSDYKLVSVCVYRVVFWAMRIKDVSNCIQSFVSVPASAVPDIDMISSSVKHKSRHIYTGPCRSVRLSRTCNLRDSLWCNHSAAVLCTLCLLLGGYSTQRPTSLHQCPPSPILLAVEYRSVVRLPGSSNAQPDMLLSSHAEEAYPSSVECC